MASNRYYFLRFPGGKPKAFTLSYDDGVEQDERLISIMDRHGIKGTFNINYGNIRPEDKVYEVGRIHRIMTLAQMKKVYQSPNVEVACHSLTHPSLDQIPLSCVMHEIVEDRKGLEKEFGGVIRGMAYPNGSYNDQVVEVLKQAGICYARTVHSTERFDLPNDWLRLPATCHHKNPRLMELANTFIDMKVSREPKLFYLWGHTYEFEMNDNWNVIEEFLQKIAKKEDIWYATNVEIYDYVSAYQSLCFSSDGKRVFNPSAIDIWLWNGEKDFCVAAGKTVDLN